MHHLFLNDIKILMRSWVSFLLLLIIPMAAGFILIKAMEPSFERNIFLKQFTIGVADYDKSIGSKMAISSIESEGYVSKAVQIKVLDEKEAMSRLNEGNLVCVVVIPEGFSQSLYMGNNKPIKVYVNRNDTTSSKLMEYFLGNAADLVIAAQSGIYTVYHMMLKSSVGNQEAFKIAEKAIPDLVLNAMGRKEIFRTVTISNIPETGAVQYYIVCVSVMFIMFSGILGLRLINQDLESGVIKRILISTGGIFKYIIEKILMVALLGLAEFIAVIVPLSLYYKSFFNILNIKVLLTAVMIILASASFCILVSLFSKSSAASVTWSITGIFIVCMMGGCIYPSAVMSEWLRTLSGLTFSSWALEGMLWAVADAPVSQMADSWGLLLIFSIIIVFISIIVVERGGYKFLQE